MRQRHFVNDNGRKTFSYGLQDVNLELLEFDKTADQATVTDHNSAVFQVSAPSGYVFNRILRFNSTPDYYKTSGDQEINYQIFDNANLSGAAVWDSATDTAPESSAINLSASATNSIYVVAYLEFDSTNNVSPVLEKFSLQYSVSSA